MTSTSNINIRSRLRLPEEVEIQPSPIASPVNNSTDVKPEIEMELNTLFKFIKSYDGCRERLSSFIVNCDNAIELASEIQVPILFKYILSQLEGKAEIACSIKEFYNWEQLKQFLKNQFSVRKHYSHLLTELQETKQGQLETVNQFALRIETCLSHLLTEISLANYVASEIEGRTAAMEDLALHHFTTGLKPNLSLIVRCKSPRTLNEAVNIAISEERILQTTQRRPPFDRIQRQGEQKQTMFRTRPNFQNTQTPNRNTYQNTQTFNRNIICRYCKNIGHSIEQCRKREFNNRNGPSTSSFKPQPYLTQRVNYVDDGHDEVDESKN